MKYGLLKTKYGAAKKAVNAFLDLHHMTLYDIYDVEYFIEWLKDGGWQGVIDEETREDALSFVDMVGAYVRNIIRVDDEHLARVTTLSKIREMLSKKTF